MKQFGICPIKFMCILVKMTVLNSTNSLIITNLVLSLNFALNSHTPQKHS